MARNVSRIQRQMLVVPPQRAFEMSVSLNWYWRWFSFLARAAVHILPLAVSLVSPVRQPLCTSLVLVRYQPTFSANSAPSAPAVRTRAGSVESSWADAVWGPWTWARRSWFIISRHTVPMVATLTNGVKMIRLTPLAFMRLIALVTPEVHTLPTHGSPS